MISVRKLEVMFDGINALAFIATGVIDLLSSGSVIPTILIIIILAGTLAKTYALRKYKKEVWDELARENHAQACKATLYYTQIAILVLAIVSIIWSMEFCLIIQHCLYCLEQ